MEWFSSVVHYFVDAKNKLPAKIVSALVILALFVLVDNTIGFSYFFSTGKKISQVHDLNELIERTKDSTVKAKLYSMQNEIIDRKSLKDRIVRGVYRVPETGSRINIDRFWESSYLLIIIGFGLLVAVLFSSEYPLWKRLLFVPLVFAIAVSLSGLFYWLSNLFGPMADKGWVNFIFNMLGQIAFITVIAGIGDPTIFDTNSIENKTIAPHVKDQPPSEGTA